MATIRIDLNTPKLKGITVYVQGKDAIFSSEHALLFTEENCSSLSYDFLMLNWVAKPALYRELNREYYASIE